MIRVVVAHVLLLAGALPAAAAGAPATSLRGSPASMERQNEVARQNEYSFLRDGAAVRRMVERGYLVRVRDGADHRLAGVSFPYARPAVATFIERLASQYREACGQPLVVTSLTRPTSLQPGNAHRLSVHPAGMAVDLRISQRANCRSWLEGTLLGLERRGLLDATRERRPPHYHVAVFPDAYAEHVERVTGGDDSPSVEPASRPASLEPAGAQALATPRAAEAASAAPSVREAPRTEPVPLLLLSAALALLVAGFRLAPPRST